MGSELHLEFIEPIGVDEEDCVEDDVASDAEEDERFPGVSVGERPRKEGDNNCWHALKGSIKGLEEKERLFAVGHILPPLKALYLAVFLITCIPATSFCTSILIVEWFAKFSQIPEEWLRFTLQVFSK